jgi:hypothetical protein
MSASYPRKWPYMSKLSRYVAVKPLFAVDTDFVCAHRHGLAKGHLTCTERPDCEGRSSRCEIIGRAACLIMRELRTPFPSDALPITRRRILKQDAALAQRALETKKPQPMTGTKFAERQVSSALSALQWGAEFFMIAAPIIWRLGNWPLWTNNRSSIEQLTSGRCTAPFQHRGRKNARE